MPRESMCSTTAKGAPRTLALPRKEAEGARFYGWAAARRRLPMLGQIALVDNLIRLIELGSSGPRPRVLAHLPHTHRERSPMDGVTPCAMAHSRAPLAWHRERTAGSFNGSL